jgi:hypothetical protein
MDQSMTDDERFLQEFEASRLPKDQWHHQQHIMVAYLYLCRYTFPVAMDRLRDRIKALNAAHQVPEHQTSGYHETMTQAWLRLVSLTLKQFGPAASAESFYLEHPELSQTKVLRLFYSRELIMSMEAKHAYVQPDLAPFSDLGSE